MGITDSISSIKQKETALQVDEIAYPIAAIRDRLGSVHEKINQLQSPQQSLITTISTELCLVLEEIKVLQDKLNQQNYGNCTTVEEALKLAKRELEVRVEERTTELRFTNDHLLSEVVERKRAEVDLERSLSLLRGTLEATIDGILVTQNAETIVAFNQRFVEMWGIPEVSLSSRDLKKVLPFIVAQMKDPDTFLAAANQLFAQADAKSDSIFELQDGRIIERYSQPQWLGETIVGRVCSFRDITVRYRSQLALRKSEATNKALLNAIPDLMIRMSRDGTYLNFIPAKNFDRVLPCSQMEGKNIYEVMPKEIAQQRMHYVEQALITGEPQSYEFPLNWMIIIYLLKKPELWLVAMMKY